MQALTVLSDTLQSTGADEFKRIDKAIELCANDEVITPCDFPTEHFLHAGCYVRNVFLRQHSFLVGAKIKVDTVLIISGDVVINMNGASKRFCGYHIIRALNPRQQMIYANQDTNLTMLYASDVKTVEEAEQEFTDDYKQLLTRK